MSRSNRAFSGSARRPRCCSKRSEPTAQLHRASLTIGVSLTLTEDILSIIAVAILPTPPAACGDREFKHDWPGGVWGGQT